MRILFCCAFLLFFCGIINAQNDLVVEYIEDNLTTDLHILLALDETTGEPQDTSGNNLDGTLEGGATLGGNAVIDEVINSSAASVTIGEGDWIEVIDSTVIGCDSFTLMIWAKLNVDLEKQEGYNAPGTDIYSAGLFRKGNGAAAQIFFDESDDEYTISFVMFHPGGGGGSCRGGASQAAASGVAEVTIDASDFDAQESHCYIFNFDKGFNLVRTIVDGRLDLTTTQFTTGFGTFPQTDVDWKFGAEDLNTPVENEALGTIDVVAVWTKTIKASDMLELGRRGHEGALLTRGDCNQDGNINIADSTYILDYILGNNSPTCFEALDTNNDAIIGVGDYIFLNAYLFQSGPAPDDPFGSNSCTHEIIDQNDLTCLSNSDCE